MSDLISRKAAIDAMQDLPYGYQGMVRDIIYNLPPEKQNKTCEFWDSESSFCALNRPSARPECEDAVSKEAVSSWLKQYGQEVLSELQSRTTKRGKQE